VLYLGSIGTRQLDIDKLIRAASTPRTRMAYIISLAPNSMLPKTPLPQIHRKRMWTRSARREAAHGRAAVKCQVHPSQFAPMNALLSAAAVYKTTLDCLNAIGKSIVPSGRAITQSMGFGEARPKSPQPPTGSHPLTIQREVSHTWAVAPNAGLCDSCSYQRLVRNTRGSSFLLCERSRTDPAFPRYPRLPVTSCVGYEPSSGDSREGTP
jgi:hypothetical protein